MDSIEYRPGLATWQLIVEVRELLAAERRAERLVCRYLADLADRVQQRQDLALHRYADELHAARSCFGLGARDARERIRVGRALRQLPQIERAFVEGELCYSRVREVTRIATVADEPEWLELARRLDMRTLERRVATARASLCDDDAASFGTRPKTPSKTRRVTFDLSARAYDLLQQALERERALSGECSDAEALERLVQDALSAHARATDHGCAGSTTQPANLPPPANPAHAANPAYPTQREQPRVEPKSIPRWSWDELGWGATEHGSWDDDESQGADARGDGTTQRGSGESDEGRGAGALGGGTTRRGSSEGDERRRDGARDVEQREAREREHDRWSEINTRLLRAMGGSGRWIPDSLIEASGLSASEVNSALTLLQLSGRIRRRAGAFEPV